VTIDAWGQHPTLRGLAAALASMDRAGVDRMLISAWIGPRNLAISNDEIAAVTAEAGGRLIGVGSVDISRPMEAVREVRRCVRELGFKAVRLLPWLWQAPPTDRRFYPLYVACIEEGVPLCVQVGHENPLAPLDVGRPTHLDQVAADFPDLVIVAGHIGRLWTEEAIATARRRPNVCLDTSACAPERLPPRLLEYLRGDGASRVLFASDAPIAASGEALRALDGVALSDEVRTSFLSENAECVFKL
jgi:predicted TIM-barrel fold metal-dependent hydrolase